MAYRDAFIARLRFSALVLGRALVYATGFLYNFVFSKLLSPSEFGSFATVMSAAELLAALCTMGGSLLIYRYVRRSQAISVTAMALMMIVGTVIASLITIVVNGISELYGQILMNGLLVAVPLGASVLLISGYRGLGRVTIFVIDPAIRYVLYISLIISAYLCVQIDSFGALVTVSLANFILATVYGGVLAWQKRLSTEIPPIEWNEQWSILMTAVAGFMVRKSDLLIFAFGISLAAMGGLKIAIVLAEAPLQFVQVLYFQHASLFEFQSSHADAKRRSVAVNLALTAVALTLAMYAVSQVLQSTVLEQYRFTWALPYLAGYFLCKLITIPLDQAYVMGNKTRELMLTYGIMAGAKLLTLGAGIMLLGENAVLLYPIVGLVEICIVECSTRYSFGKSFFHLLIGSNPSVRLKSL
ncbi:hypothetical protein LRP30_09130 [Bradyrhizobium sp. C-145]|uniref:lipopolysaccharide biosynthesis protein n=1 Tax=Bradyrhizobium sp. C-145 TaxID=574727 RepID=UPI00201B80B4|nr:hypothetical protein [Bradyrhizobium sp. C-145]UQR65386.1 hypothetical protein LRP30_09130 [Bradyrhizobium sp. C-145]